MELVHLGSARKAHGLKGHAIFLLFSEKETTLTRGSRVVLRPLAGSRMNGEQEFVLEELHIGNDVRAKLEGVPDRTALELLLPFDIYIDEADLPELAEGEFYVSDLLGLDVQNTEGKKVGKLADFYETAAHTVFVIKTNRGELIDVPYVEAFFKDIDLDNAVVTVEMPEEME